MSRLLHFHVVTDIEVLQFPEMEIERKLQRNFQTDFIKLMLEHKGGKHKEQEVPLSWLPGLAQTSCFYKLGINWACGGPGWSYFRLLSGCLATIFLWSCEG